MARLNEHYLKLAAGYLFPEISRRVNAFTESNAEALKKTPIIKLGIGDVTEPLPEACRTAMIKAVNEMGRRETFRGYGPEQGYGFLREAIAANDYEARGCDIAADEIFISDGSKCDTGNILDIFAPDRDANRIAVCDPVYPVYVDTNVMAGHTGEPDENGRYEGLVYMPMHEGNDFTPALPEQPVDLIYLCYPNNPTGATTTREELAKWVAYAREHDAVILFDSAYEAYINSPSIPHSIYEIDGARQCAIEFRSFSKSAGFTGVRCAYTVVPKELTAHTVSYLVQRGAEAVYSQDGQSQINQLIAFYLENARMIREAMTEAGLDVFGGVHAPYVWIKAPEGVSSWDLFDRLLERAHVVGTPGSGFGAAGEGYFRISAFNSRENVEQALQRITQNLKM